MLILKYFVHVGELANPFNSIIYYKAYSDVILMQHNGIKECFMSPNGITVFSFITQRTALDTW